MLLSLLCTLLSVGLWVTLGLALPNAPTKTTPKNLTNAERLSKGLPPNPSPHLYTPDRVRRQTTSQTACTDGLFCPGNKFYFIATPRLTQQETYMVAAKYRAVTGPGYMALAPSDDQAQTPIAFQAYKGSVNYLLYSEKKKGLFPSYITLFNFAVWLQDGRKGEATEAAYIWSIDPGTNRLSATLPGDSTELSFYLDSLGIPFLIYPNNADTPGPRYFRVDLSVEAAS